MSLVDKEIKQVEQGMCWATRYNPKTGKTEVCKHKTECELAIKFVEYSNSGKPFYDCKDYVGSQYIKKWRTCKVWKFFCKKK